MPYTEQELFATTPSPRKWREDELFSAPESTWREEDLFGEQMPVSSTALGSPQFEATKAPVEADRVPEIRSEPEKSSALKRLMGKVLGGAGEVVETAAGTPGALLVGAERAAGAGLRSVGLDVGDGVAEKLLVPEYDKTVRGVGKRTLDLPMVIANALGRGVDAAMRGGIEVGYESAKNEIGEYLGAKTPEESDAAVAQVLGVDPGSGKEILARLVKDPLMLPAVVAGGAGAIGAAKQLPSIAKEIPSAAKAVSSVVGEVVKKGADIITAPRIEQKIAQASKGAELLGKTAEETKPFALFSEDVRAGKIADDLAGKRWAVNAPSPEVPVAVEAERIFEEDIKKAQEVFRINRGDVPFSKEHSAAYNAYDKAVKEAIAKRDALLKKDIRVAPEVPVAPHGASRAAVEGAEIRAPKTPMEPPPPLPRPAETDTLLTIADKEAIRAEAIESAKMRAAKVRTKAEADAVKAGVQISDEPPSPWFGTLSHKIMTDDVLKPVGKFISDGFDASERFSERFRSAIGDAIHVLGADMAHPAAFWKENRWTSAAMEERWGRVVDALDGKIPAESLPTLERRAHDTLRPALEHARKIAIEKRGLPDNWGLTEYFPHTWGKWKVVMDKHPVVAGDTPLIFERYDDALKAAVDYADKNPSAQNRIRVTQDVVVSDLDAQVIGPKQYYAMVGNVMRETGMTVDEARDALRGIFKPGQKSKFVGFMEKRKGYQGYDKSPQALMLYARKMGRGLYLDESIRESQRYLDEAQKAGVLSQNSERKKLADSYMSYINGSKTEDERGLEVLVRKVFGTEKYPLRRANNVIKKFTYFSRMGYNPASAIVNLSQTPINTWPVLGRFTWVGLKKVLPKYRTPEDNAVLDKLGVLIMEPKTYDWERAAGEGVSFSRTHFPEYLAPLYMFNGAERLNRGIAGLGAYHKARSEGKTMQQAIQYASEVIDRTQFRYDAVGTIALFEQAKAAGVDSLVVPFKRFLIKEIEFISGLNAKEMGRFAVASTVVGGSPIYGAFDLATGGKLSEIVNKKASEGDSVAMKAVKQLGFLSKYGALGYADIALGQRAGIGNEVSNLPNLGSDKEVADFVFRYGGGYPISIVRQLVKAVETKNPQAEREAWQKFRKILMPIVTVNMANAAMLEGGVGASTARKVIGKKFAEPEATTGNAVLTALGIPTVDEQQKIQRKLQKYN